MPCEGIGEHVRKNGDTLMLTEKPDDVISGHGGIWRIALVVADTVVGVF